MTGDEVVEFESHIAAIRQSDEKKRRLAQLSGIVAEMAGVSDSLGRANVATHVDALQAGEIYRSMDLVAAALKRLGFTKADGAAALAEAGRMTAPDGVTRRKTA